MKRIQGTDVEIVNVYRPASSRSVHADAIVMATARASENAIYQVLRDRGVSVEAIGCAVAPRTAYEATFEGHRAARKLGALPFGRGSRDPGRSRLPQRDAASS